MMHYLYNVDETNHQHNQTNTMKEKIKIQILQNALANAREIRHAQIIYRKYFDVAPMALYIGWAAGDIIHEIITLRGMTATK